MICFYYWGRLRIVGREKISQNSVQTFQADFKKSVFESIALKLIKTELDFTRNWSDLIGDPNFHRWSSGKLGLPKNSHMTKTFFLPAGELAVFLESLTQPRPLPCAPQPQAQKRNSTATLIPQNQALCGCTIAWLVTVPHPGEGYQFRTIRQSHNPDCLILRKKAQFMRWSALDNI